MIKRSIVTFPSEVVESQVRSQLQKPVGNITGDDLLRVESFDIGMEEHIEGYFDIISQMLNLQSLSITYCQLKDLSFLTNLKSLKELDLQMNSIINISPLAGLTQLEYLNIGITDVEDLSPLKDLRNLRQLIVSCCPIIIKTIPKPSGYPLFDYQRIYNDIDVFDEDYSEGVKKRIIKALNGFIEHPCKDSAFGVIHETLRKFEQMQEFFSADEAEEFFKQRLADPRIRKEYVLEFIKEKPLGEKGLEFIGDFGSSKAKRIGMEYELTQVHDDEDLF